MNLKDARYKDFALVHEMLETPQIVGDFDFQASAEAAAAIRQAGRLFLTGEGSSRIFPAKNLICEALKIGVPLAVSTEGARQAHEYDLSSSPSLGPATAARRRN